MLLPMFCALNGTSPSAAMAGGVANAWSPSTVGVKEPLNTSMPRPQQRTGEAPTRCSRWTGQCRRPGVVASIWAVVPALLFHANMVPFRLAKMKLAGLLPTRNALVLLLTDRWVLGAHWL